MSISLYLVPSLVLAALSLSFIFGIFYGIRMVSTKVNEVDRSGKNCHPVPELLGL